MNLPLPPSGCQRDRLAEGRLGLDEVVDVEARLAQEPGKGL
jgi:hypothetical protein